MYECLGRSAGGEFVDSGFGRIVDRHEKVKPDDLEDTSGFVTPDQGSIVLDGSDIAKLPPEKRDVGMVFQNYALFPHRNVFKNVAFGLERRKLAKDEIGARVTRALSMVRLDGLEHRAPSELSGGQQQRVALARALVIEPTLLLLDEPLSNLDASLRGDLRLEIRRIQRELAITTVLVTHDQEEALSVSDRIAVLHQGRLQQLGSPGWRRTRSVVAAVASGSRRNRRSNSASAMSACGISSAASLTTSRSAGSTTPARASRISSCDALP